jgi:extradiol dioxygenase family protein
LAGSALKIIFRRTIMKFGGFLHLNIRCSPEDIPTIEKFYGDVLGLKTGYRPD